MCGDNPCCERLATCVSVTVAHEYVWRQDDTQSWHIVGRPVPWIAFAFAFLLVFLAVIGVHLKPLSGYVYLAILHSLEHFLSYTQMHRKSVGLYL